MRRRPLARVLVFVLVLAGCIAPGAVPIHPVSLDLTIDHDHTSVAGHTLARGLARVGGADLDTLLLGEPGRASDLQFHDGRGLAAMAVNGGSGGFVLMNASDLSVVSRYRSASEDNWYVKFTPDGKYVLLTANGNFHPEPAEQTALESLTRGAFTHAARGMQVIDISDPKAPKLAGVYAAPIRLINIAPWEKDGVTYAAVSVVNDRSIMGAPKPGVEDNVIEILRLDTGIPVKVGSYTPDKTLGPDVFAHDLSVQVHPITGKTLLYAACWDAGAYILDVTDPATPALVSHFRPEGDTPQTHTVKPAPALLDGKHYTLLSPETFAGQASGVYQLLDTTDPARPALVASWALPGDLTNAESLLWSPHEFTIDGTRAYTSNYHAGVIVLDLPSLAPVAAWDAPPSPPRQVSAKWSIDIETAVWHEGRVYDVDMGRGIDILAPTSR